MSLTPATTAESVMNCAFARLGREPRKRRLAAARRSPEHHRMRDALRQQAMQRPPGPEQVLLADEFREARRPHARGERAMPGVGGGFDRQFGLLAHGSAILAPAQPVLDVAGPVAAAIADNQPGREDPGGICRHVAPVALARLGQEALRDLECSRRAAGSAASRSRRALRRRCRNRRARARST